MKYFVSAVILGAVALPGALWAEAPVAATKPSEGITAVKAVDFLNSIGANVHVQHGHNAAKLVECAKYLGLRNIRDGADGNWEMAGLLLLHKQAGVHVVLSPGSGAKEDSLQRTITAARELAAAGALLAVEGPNEPNNFGGVTYQGDNSTKTKSWVPVAKYQRDLYHAVKSDPVLKDYPVFGISEAGAEDDNAGLQYLTIPAGAGTLMPDGTVFADFANVHNYLGHPNWPGLHDNQTRIAADPTSACKVDGIYGNHGKTWRKGYQGYSEEALLTLPKVTTETGWVTDNTPAGDDIQGKVFLKAFLQQYKAGWKHTFIYELMDDPDGAYGFYKTDYVTARKSATYLHNFTSILADSGTLVTPGQIAYAIPNRPDTVHDLLMQKSDGTFELVVWGERVKGTNDVIVNLGGTYPSAKLYDPTVGTTATQTLSNISSVPLTLGDNIVVLELQSKR